MSDPWAVEEEFDQLKNCALSILCGEQIGSGSTRRVYALKHDPSLVIKIEHAARRFCNVTEYDVWKEVRRSENAKWFAPVVDIDIWGGALLMKRTQPITDDEFFDEIKELPSFMSDTHPQNFGRLDGRIVCHDYGYHKALSVFGRKATMKPVKREDYLS